MLSWLRKKRSPAQNLTETIERIDFEHLGLELGDKALFQDFSYQFAKDKHYAIIGESGRGKSTLMKLLLNYLIRRTTLVKSWSMVKRSAS